MKHTKSLFTILFIVFFPLIESNFLGINVLAKNPPNNPYIKDSVSTFKIVDNSEQLDGASFDLKVYDNSSLDFYNDVIDYNSSENWSSEFNLIYSQNTELDSNHTDKYIYPSLEQSDIENGEYRFFMGGLDTSTPQYIQLYALSEFNVALDNSKEDIDNFIPIDYSGNHSIGIPQENRSFTTEDINNTNYATINNYTNSESVFRIDNFNSNNVVFTIQVLNWENPLDQIEVSLTDQNEEISRYATKPYTANLISSDSGSNLYTYEIDNLYDTSYKFYSLNNTKLTLSGSLNYLPQNTINFSSDLEIPDEKLIFNVNNENPYIIDQGFSIDDSSVTSSSIQFTIEVVDTVDSKFYNDLLNEGKNIDVTINDGTDNIETTAVWIDDVQPTDGIYKFKIDGLSSGITYSIYSLNNTNLSVGGPSIAIDDEITTSDDLNIISNSFTTTQVPYIVENGFFIDENSVDKQSIEFTITVMDWDTSAQEYTDDLSIRLINNTIGDGTNEIYSANFISKSGNDYTYRISDLSDNTNYEIYSIVNPPFALFSSDQELQSELLLSDINTTGESPSFLTRKQNNITFYTIIIAIVIVLIISMFLVKALFSKPSEPTPV